MSTPRISVLCATRLNVGKLRTLVESIRQTAAGPVEVVCRIDFDDQNSYAYLCMNEIPFVVGPRRDGYASVPSFFNEAASIARGEILFVVGDDAEFVTPEWDEKILAHAAQYPDGMFVLGVDTANADNFVFPCVTRKLVNALGFLFDERLVYPDIWLRDTLYLFGRSIRIHDVEVIHHWAGTSPDQQRALGKVYAAGYNELYGQCVEEARKKLWEQPCFKGETVV